MNNGRICFLTSYATILRRSQFSTGRTTKRQASHMPIGPRYFNIYRPNFLGPIPPIFHRDTHTQQKNGSKNYTSKYANCIYVAAHISVVRYGPIQTRTLPHPRYNGISLHRRTRVRRGGTENNRTPSVSGPTPTQYILNDGTLWVVGHDRLYYPLKTSFSTKSTDISKCIFKDTLHSNIFEAFGKFNH
jgi:hypothetical protein